MTRNQSDAGMYLNNSILTESVHKQIVSIEGLAGAGKTTLMQALAERNYDIIPEICDYVPQSLEQKKFTVAPHSSMVANKWFLQIEIERMGSALRSKRSVILDRSFISQIAYNFAKDRVYSTNNLEHLKLLMKPVMPFIPYVVYLQMDTGSSIRRMASRNKQNQYSLILSGEPDFLPDFLEQNRLYYEKLIPVFGEDMLVLSASTPLQDQVSEFDLWVKSRSAVVPIIDFERLFH